MVIVNRTDGPPISPGPSALPVTAAIFVTVAVSCFLIGTWVVFEIDAVFVGCGVGEVVRSTGFGVSVGAALVAVVRGVGVVSAGAVLAAPGVCVDAAVGLV